MPNNAKPWKTIAWNGASLSVPSDWELSELETRALRVQGQAGLGVELDWKGSGRNASDEPLPAPAPPSGGVSIQTPMELAAAAKALEEAGLSANVTAWTGKDGRQTAELALRDAKAGLDARARIIFPHTVPPSWGAAARLLAGIRLHGADGPVPWAAHGLAATLPGELELTSFATHPGHFRMRLSQGRGRCATELVLDRLTPADELMGDTALNVFADRLYGNLGAEAGFFVSGPGPDAASGRAERRPSLLARLTCCGKLRALAGRAWLPGDKVILAACMRARNLEALDPFDAICAALATDDSQAS